MALRDLALEITLEDGEFLLVHLRLATQFVHGLQQHLGIVQPAERLLRPLEVGDRLLAGPEATFAGQLRGVPQLLGRDAHGMQSVRKVDATGVIDCLAEFVRAPRDAAAKQPRPTRRQRFVKWMPPVAAMLETKLVPAVESEAVERLDQA